MKNFFSISFIALALFVGAVGAAPAAHAQRVCQDVDATLCTNDGGTFNETDCTCTPAATAAAPAAPATDANAPATDTKPSVDPNKTPIVSADNPQALTLEDGGAMSKVMVFLMGIFAWLVGVAVLTLDYAVYYTVITMGNYVHNLSAVGVAWRILRDLGNILLIFGFLAIGISVILDTDVYGYGTKMLPTLLVAAVLLNFSLFITEAVIDVGNLFATQFYTQINGGSLPQAGPSGLLTTASGVALTPGNEGISQKIMSQLGLVTVYSDALNNPGILKGANTTLIGFMSIILFIITAFVLFSLAFILIARFVVLIFLIILAPIGFVGYVVPKLGGLSKQWTDKLVEQTLTAPVLLFLLYVALIVITDANFLGFGPNRDWSGFVDTNGSMNLTGFASQILSFLVAMGILLMVIVFSKKLGAAGAAGATKFAGKLTFGATAWGMRSTVGAGSQRLSRAIRTNKLLGGTKFGRVLAGTFDRGAKGSFDIRGTGALKSLPLGGLDAGAAQKGGYRARQEASVKGHQDYIKSVGEAIDERGATKEEQKIIDKVEAEATTKREAFKKAKEEHETAKEQLDPQIKLQEAEVKRLEKIEADRLEKAKAELAQLEEEKVEEIKNGGGGVLTIEHKIATARQNLTAKDAENEKKLETAQQNLSKSKNDLAEAFNKESKAKGELTKAEIAETKANKESGDRISADKKKAQLAYAENAKGVVSWAAYGPGGALAAKKIIKDTKKNPDKEFSKKLMKAMKASEKEETEEGEEKKGKNEGEKPEESANKSTP